MDVGSRTCAARAASHARPQTSPRCILITKGEIEGSYLSRLRSCHERKPGMHRKKIAVVEAQTGGGVAREVCGFDFAQRHSALGQDFIECHQIEPLHVGDEKPRSIKDFAFRECRELIYQPGETRS